MRTPPRCPFKRYDAGNMLECGLIADLTHYPAPTNRETCNACLGADRRFALNEFTIHLMHEDVPQEIQEKLIAQLSDPDMPGIGTELQRLFRSFGFSPNHNCGCGGTKDLLNAWSIAEIKAKEDDIVRLIADNARHHGIPFAGPLARRILRHVIAKYQQSNF